MEDKFPAYPPGGRARIPQRLLDEAEGNPERAFVLWWAEHERESMRKLIEDLKWRGTK